MLDLKLHLHLRLFPQSNQKLTNQVVYMSNYPPPFFSPFFFFFVNEAYAVIITIGSTARASSGVSILSDELSVLVLVHPRRVGFKLQHPWSMGKHGPSCIDDVQSFKARRRKVLTRTPKHPLHQSNARICDKPRVPTHIRFLTDE